ncbi:MAG: helix-turn-helix domain-containing protein [Ruminococcaceae bacterium]|nr:helix-turn-helix domain-containing protein [Oscillospiraceae bacterium]
MTKDTTRLVEELSLCKDFNTYYDEHRDYMVQQSLSELLETLIEKHGLKKSQVIRAAEMSEVYAYQILSGLRIPERNKLLNLAVAMQLPLDEVQTLLRCAGYSTLYVKLPFDCVLLYGICHHLSVVQINDILYDYGLETLR